MIRSFVTAVLALTVVTSAQAQWKDCTPPELKGTYHLFLDDVRYPDEASPSAEMKTLRNALVTSVKNQIEAMKLQNLSRIRPLDCPGRFPRAGDFTSSRMMWMNNRGVVMELWTTIRQAAAKQYDAEFNVVVIPAMLAKTSGLFTIDYGLQGGQTTDKLLAVIRHHPELNAYALIGAGLRAVENKDYDYASAYLCRGLGELQQAPNNPDNATLRAFVDAATAKVIADAKRDRDYVGPLKFPGRGQGCPR